MITVVTGDLLAASADAIVLPVDGTFVPGAGRFDRLLGAIGAQFIRRFPEAELLEEIEAQADLPLGLGQAAAVELPIGPPTVRRMWMSTASIRLLRVSSPPWCGQPADWRESAARIADATGAGWSSWT